MRRFPRRDFLAASLAATALPRLAAGGEPTTPAETQTTADVPWLAEVQTPPKSVPADASHLSPLLMDADGRAITTVRQWQTRRESLRRWWLDFLHPLDVARTGPPKVTVLDQDRPEGVIRELIRYEVEPGQPTEAYLLRPARQQGRVPGVVVLHSTVPHTIRQGAGVEGRPEKAFGLKLARRGCVAICPRCFLWPDDLETDSTKKLSYAQRVERFQARHPGSRGMAKMLYDARVAVDMLAARPEVDPQRLGAVGHSLGAKEVLYLAAFDDRIRAAVSSEGGIGTRYSNWEAPWYLGSDVRGDRFGPHEHHEVLALVAPRAFLLVGGNSADGDRSWSFIEAALPVWRLYGGRPRIGLFTHGQGHSVPPEAERRIDQWLTVYLGSNDRPRLQ